MGRQPAAGNSESSVPVTASGRAPARGRPLPRVSLSAEPTTDHEGRAGESPDRRSRSRSPAAVPGPSAALATVEYRGSRLAAAGVLHGVVTEYTGIKAARHGSPTAAGCRRRGRGRRCMPPPGGLGPCPYLQDKSIVTRTPTESPGPVTASESGWHRDSDGGPRWRPPRPRQSRWPCGSRAAAGRRRQL